MTSDLQHEFTVEGKLWTLKYRDSDHSYHLREGRDGRWFRVPSASTIAKVSYNDPGGLMGWAVKETQEGRDWRDPQAKEWGTAAHEQLEHLALKGKALTLTDQPEHVRGCVQGVASWWLEHRPVFKASEVIVASPSMRVAGRFDFIAEVDGELVLGDLKTSKPQDWDDWARHKANPAFVQLAGYAAMYAESRWEAPQPTARYILRVGADGNWDWKRDLCPELSEAAFKTKLEAYRADSAWGRAYKAAEKEIAEAWAA